MTSLWAAKKRGFSPKVAECGWREAETDLFFYPMTKFMI